MSTTTEQSLGEFIPVITTLLDQDLYKITMMQAFLHANPGAIGKYRFKCRKPPAAPLTRLIAEINRQLDHLCQLRFQAEELDWLRTLRYLKSDFVDFLEGFQLRRRFIKVRASQDDADELEIEVEGPIVQGMMFEIFVLAIVSELHYRDMVTPEVLDEGKRRLKAKMEQLVAYFDLPANRLLQPFEFFDFGTRRRFSRAWQETVVTALASHMSLYFKGTSNMDLARRLNITPIGTMAHEYLQAYQGFGPRLRDFQKAALEGWVQEYRGDLGIALTDVVGVDAFLRDFDLYFAKLFDGVRHDSGDPFAWGEKIIDHYNRLGIAPSTKRLVFSDGLDISKALELYAKFGSRTRNGFGIGTKLSNDLGLTPLEIVMKLVEVNEQPVAKISDSPGKTMSNNKEFLDYLRQVFNIKKEDV